MARPTRTELQIEIYPDRVTTGRAAARQAAQSLISSIQSNGTTRLILATGTSQLDFLEALTATAGIDWPQVEMFHLDEYIGLPLSHRASFRRYLLDRFINRVTVGRYYLLDGEHPTQSADEIGRVLSARPGDLACVGIGENCHLAFNDPPADFTTEQPYLIVTLDAACRRQQVGEGWFASIDEVPTHAISMSVRQILKSAEIIGVVPDSRKANAVKACVEGPVSPMAPASILQTHSNTTLYLDRDSAALLAVRCMHEPRAHSLKPRAYFDS